jgi:glycine cleavage system H protein
MNIPEDLKYTGTHEWVKLKNDIAICGITDYAQTELSDVVQFEFPEIGTEVKKGKPFATVEAVKAVSDIYAPLSGKLIEINEKIINSPELVNHDPYGDGWMVKIKPSNSEELNDLLVPDDYRELIEKEE